MTFQEFKTEVRKRMRERNDNLESLFKNGKYHEMQRQFTLNTRLVTHEGDYIPGEISEDYWRKVGDELNGTNLKLREKYFDAKELILSPDHTENDFNYVAMEVTEFSFNANDKKYEGYIDPPYRHRVRCDMH